MYNNRCLSALERCKCLLSRWYCYYRSLVLAVLVGYTVPQPVANSRTFCKIEYQVPANTYIIFGIVSSCMLILIRCALLISSALAAHIAACIMHFCTGNRSCIPVLICHQSSVYLVASIVVKRGWHFRAISAVDLVCWSYASMT